MWILQTNVDNRWATRWVQKIGGFSNIPVPDGPGRFIRFLLVLDAIGLKVKLALATVLFTFINVIVWNQFQIINVKSVSVFFGPSYSSQPVKDDNISILFTVLGGSELLFQDLYPNFMQQSVETASFIILMGVGLQLFLKFDTAAYKDDKKKQAQIAFWVLFDFVLFYVANLSVSRIPLSIAPEFSTASVTQQQGFLILIAIAEERFFRGLLLNAFIKWSKNSGVAIAADAVIFAIYHSAVYGGNLNAFIIILIAGAVISASDIRTGRIITGMAAHILNNAV